jgi:hypothetical protein
MRNLPILLDELAGASSYQDHAELLDRPMFHLEAVEQRCADLTERLEIAEVLAASLRATAEQQRRHA